MKAKKPAKKIVKKVAPKKKSAPLKVNKTAVRRLLKPYDKKSKKMAHDVLKKAITKLANAAGGAKGHKVAESNLWNWFSQGVIKALADPDMSPMVKSSRLHMRRVENSVSAGGSDVDLCFDGVCALIELKAVPRAEPVDTGITTAQAMFARARSAAGGYAWILLQVGDGPRYLIPGKKALDCIGKVPEKTLWRLSAQLIDGSPLDILNAATGR